jgi:hypothetical protein
LLATSECAIANDNNLTMDTHDLMNWVLNPAAEAIWDSAGYYIEVGTVQNLPDSIQIGLASSRSFGLKGNRKTSFDDHQKNKTKRQQTLYI